MFIKGVIKKGQYFDSVSLMIVAREINDEEGVIDSAVIMGTGENKAILKASGLLLPEFAEAEDTDLLIAVKAESREITEQIINKIDERLNKLRAKHDKSGAQVAFSMDSALDILPEANLALISVPGKYAAAEAFKALQRGINVMIFSDNVPLQQEIELKKYALERDLLVMGPDCGTAIINGVPLAFANAVNRGDIGIVAASGTGLQEVSCIITNEGAGISQAIGTGGRDISKEVGGLMFLFSLKLLLADHNTKVILLVSKPPHVEVLEKIGNLLQEVQKPVVSVFLNADPELSEQYGIIPATTLEQGARYAVNLSTGKNITDITAQLKKRETELIQVARDEASKLKDDQQYLRALYSGGTFCYEAQVILGSTLSPIYSNAPVGKTRPLKDSWKSERHTIIDLGADEFTVGRPHPMIDFSLRNKRLLTEAHDPHTAVILLDVVLGYGANPDPIADLLPTIKNAQQIAHNNGRHLPIICSVVGTNKDPQNRARVIQSLADAGVLVMDSNAAACLLAQLIIDRTKS